MIVIGISISFFLQLFPAVVGRGQLAMDVSVQAVPAGLYFLLLTLVPESPRWLPEQRPRRERAAALCAVQGSAAADRELEIIQASFIKESAAFWRPRTAYGTAQARHGIRSGHSLLPTGDRHQRDLLLPPHHTSRHPAASSRRPSLSRYSWALVNVGMTFRGHPGLIDRLGRKPLLSIGLTGMTLSLLTISWAFHATHASPEAGSVSHANLVFDCHHYLMLPPSRFPWGP